MEYTQIHKKAADMMTLSVMRETLQELERDLPLAKENIQKLEEHLEYRKQHASNGEIAIAELKIYIADREAKGHEDFVTIDSGEAPGSSA